MDCKAARKWMSPYLDSELDSALTFEVGEHLRSCRACQERFEAERHAEQEIRRLLASDEMPASLWPQLRREVADGGRASRGAVRRRWALAASLLLLIGAASYYRYRLMQQEEGPWIVRELALLAEEDIFSGGAMPVAGTRPGFEDVNFSAFGSRLAIRATGHGLSTHHVSLISATTVEDEDGRPYVEVRLNCCGQPLLLVIAEDGASTVPARLANGFSNRLPTDVALEGVNVASRQTSGLILMAASRHPVQHIIRGLELERV